MQQFDNISSSSSSIVINGTGELPGVVGFAAASVAVAFLGSNYLPVKQFDNYDGVAYQMHRAIGIWMIGLVVNAVRGFPKFQPFAMIGGAVCATGNLAVVPIIQTIGMGLGLLIWGTTNMLSGWASGRFGWFDIPAQVPHRTVLNYIGVSLSVVSAAVIFFINPNTTPPADAAARSEDNDGLDGRSPLLRQASSDQVGSVSIFDDAAAAAAVNSDLRSSSSSRHDDDDVALLDQHQEQQQQSKLIWMRLPPSGRKAFGVTLAVMIGPTFGLAFVPAYYVQSHTPNASQSGLDYVFSHFTGILCASMLYFCAYAAAMRNLPAVNPRVILPAVASGLMWGIAAAAWFLANQVLSESVAFPIITTAPAVVAALWGVCVFKEIKGARNLIILTLAFATTTTGSVLNGMSR